MEYELAYRKLVNHANLSDQLPEKESIVFNLWQSIRVEKLPDLQSFCSDILACFEVINKSINGDKPSMSSAKTSTIDRNLVRAVTSIIEGCQEYSLVWDKRSLYTKDARMQLRKTVWLFAHGWNAILDGDVDSITEHVMLTSITKDLT